MPVPEIAVCVAAQPVPETGIDFLLSTFGTEKPAPETADMRV